MFTQFFCFYINSEPFFTFCLDIEQLKKKKLKIEIELATDEKNKETIANQIRLLTEKLDEIDHRQQQKKVTLSKIDDTLTQSEIGIRRRLTFYRLEFHTNVFPQLQVTRKSSIPFKCY